MRYYGTAKVVAVDDPKHWNNAMNAEMQLTNRVKSYRVARGWSQDELAQRAGISRASVSAIETERLSPSAAAALTLAAAFQCRVEDIFQIGETERAERAWAWAPRREKCRYWIAEIRGKKMLFPAESSNLGLLPHDGIFDGGELHDHGDFDPARTLVVASCDPAIGLLASLLHERHGVRLLAFSRSSREALSLLKQGVVHAAGIHFAKAGQRDRNASVAADSLDFDFSLLHMARWQEGLAVTPGLHVRSVQAALNAKIRWVARENGSAARELLNQLREDQAPPRRTAQSHRAVAEAIRSGWADVGVCLRLVSEEAELDFLPVREEEYDLCFAKDCESDPRLRALTEIVRSEDYRRKLSELPGYDAASAGQIENVKVERANT